MSKSNDKITFKNPDLPLAVVVAQTRWNEPPRMRHDVTRQLLRWFNVLFVEFFPVRNKVSGGLKQEDRNLIIYNPVLTGSPPIRLYANDPITHGRVNRRYTFDIEKVVKHLGSECVILFNFVYHLPEIMHLSVFRYRAYVCFDEFPKMQRSADKRNPFIAAYQERLFQLYENRVAKAADHCFTPHYPLRDKLLAVNDKIEMLFHAHNFSSVSFSKRREPGDRIKVGFAGYINYRIIQTWLLELLKYEDFELHLIGPMDGPELECYTGHRNVSYVEPLYGKDLKRKLTEMDVLVMPYDSQINEVRILTTNSKTFQYIASGRPIVISNLENYIEMPQGIFYKAIDAEDFVAKIRKAYSEDCEKYRLLRAKIASENTWDKRGEQLHGILKNAIGDILPNLEDRLTEQRA